MTIKCKLAYGVGDILRRKQGWGGTCGGGQGPSFLPSNGASKTKKKNYILALDGCHSKYNQATTNQKYVSVFDNGTKEWYKWGGMQGGLLCIVLVAIKKQYIRKDKIIH